MALALLAGAALQPMMSVLPYELVPAAEAAQVQREPSPARVKLESRRLERLQTGLKLPEPLPGIPDEMLERLRAGPPAPGTDADLTLEQVRALDRWKPVPPPAMPEPTPRDRQAALRAYLSGQLLLADEKAAEALKNFIIATEKDAASSEAWVARGKTHLMLGSEFEARRAFEMAIKHGARDAMMLEALAQSVAEGDHVAALQYGLLALDADAADPEPGRRELLSLDLASNLLSLGYTRAAYETMEQGSAILQLPSVSRRLLSRAESARRRAAEILVRLGDIALMRHQTELAREVYIRAEAAPSIEPADLHWRRIAAAIQGSQAFEVSLLVLDQLRDHPTRLDAPTQSLLPQLVESPVLGPVFTDALAELQASFNRSSPSVAAAVLRARATTLPDGDAQRVLADHLVDHPRDLEAAIDLARRVVPTARATAWTELARREPRAIPVLAQALFTAGADSAVWLDAIKKDTAPAAQLLAAHAERSIGDLDGAAKRLESLPASPQKSLLEGLIAIDRSDRLALDAALETLKNHPQAEPVFTPILARLLIDAQRPQQAIDALDPWIAALTRNQVAGDDRLLEALLLQAEARLAMGSLTLTNKAIDQVTIEDPLNEQAWAMRAQAVAAGTPNADAAAWNAALRTLREHWEDGLRLTLFRVSQHLEWNRTAQALEAMELRQAREPMNPALWPLTVRAWTQQAATDRHAADQAVAKLEALPAPADSPIIRAAKARILNASNRSDDAMALLGPASSAEPLALAQARDAILRTRPQQIAEADRLLIARHTDRKPLPPQAIELAQALARREAFTESANAIIDGFPPDVVATREQAAVMLQLATTITGVGNAVVAQPQRVAALALLDHLVQRAMTLPVDLHDRRLELIIDEHPDDSGRLLEAARLVGRQHPGLATAALARAAGLAHSAQRPDIALLLLSTSILESPKPETQHIHIALQLLGIAGDATLARKVIDHAHKAGQLYPTLVSILKPGHELVKPDRDPRAEAAYMIGSLAWGQRPGLEAMGMLELALEYQPRHAWANNDIGYFLADAGLDLERAEKHLLIAIEVAPQESSIVDSLGWLRYKQGRLDDQVDPDTKATIPGAITLLKQATTMPRKGPPNATAHDHLGDALWVSGRADEATASWNIAERLGLEREAGMRADPNADPGALLEMSELILSARMKRNAALTGKAPIVSPQGNKPSRGAPAPDRAAPRRGPK